MAKIVDTILIKRVEDSVALTTKNKTFLPLPCLELFAFTNMRNKILHSNLANFRDVNYLELGVFRGGTIIPVGLSKCNSCVGIDNFTYNPYRSPRWREEGWPDVENSIHDNLERYSLLNKVKIVKLDVLDTITSFSNIFNQNNLVNIDLDPITPISIKSENGVKTKSALNRFDYSNLLKKVIDSCQDNFILSIANINKQSNFDMINEVIHKLPDIDVKHTNFLREQGRNDNGWYTGVGLYVISKKVKGK